MRTRIDGLIGEGKASALHDASRAREFILTQLQAMAVKETARDGDRLKAIELIGKLSHVGAFVERSEVLTGKAETAEQIQARIEELLSRVA